MIEQLIRKANPDATVIRLDDPRTLKQELAKARKLPGQVIILMDDVDKFCKFHDPDTIAELLGGMELHEEKVDQGTGNQANRGLHCLSAEGIGLKEL